MKTDVFRKRTELVVAGDKIRLAVDLDHHADFAADVNIALDEAFLGDAVSLLGGRRRAFFAQQRDGFLDVTVGFNQGAFAVHETRTCVGAQLIDHLGRDRDGSAHSG